MFADLEAAVFYEWFHNTRAQLGKEYDYLLHQTVFLLLSNDQPVGEMRLVVPGPHEQKSLSDVGRAPFNLSVDRTLADLRTSRDKILDIVTAGLAPEARGLELIRALLGGAAIVARKFDCTFVTAVIDVNVHHYLHKIGVDLDIFPGARPEFYLGSAASIPILFPLERIGAESTSRSDSWEVSRAGLLA